MAYDYEWTDEEIQGKPQQDAGTDYAKPASQSKVRYEGHGSICEIKGGCADFFNRGRKGKIHDT